jgi:hypothetical protein
MTTEAGKLISAFHQAAGYTEAREFTDEEKERLGFPKDACCGYLGTFGIGRPLPKNAEAHAVLLGTILGGGNAHS